MAIDFAKLQETAKKVTSNGPKSGEPKEKDVRFYETERDKKTGNFSSVIRFLHSDDKNDMPFVKVVNHYFSEKDPNGKDLTFIQYCPTDIGEKCPICLYNKENWGSYTITQQNRKRKSRFYTNILVIEDKKHPEREGKVFLFSYGIKVHEKIMKMIAPDLEKNPRAKAHNIFDYKNGKNFILNISTVAGYANYDNCDWEEPSEIENMDEQIISLSEFAPKKEKFKTYEEIDSRFQKYLALLEGRRVSNNVSNSSNSVESRKASVEEKSKAEEKTEAKESLDMETTGEDEFFKFD